MNHRRGHLFVPVQECEITGRVSVGDVAPLVTPVHPARALKRRQVLGSEPIRRIHLSSVHTYQAYSPIGLDLKLAKRALEDPPEAL